MIGRSLFSIEAHAELRGEELRRRLLQLKDHINLETNESFQSYGMTMSWREYERNI